MVGPFGKGKREQPVEVVPETEVVRQEPVQESGDTELRAVFEALLAECATRQVDVSVWVEQALEKTEARAYGEALEALETTEQFDPELHGVMGCRVKIRERQVQQQEAGLSEVLNTVKRWLRSGNEFYSKGFYEEAIASYDKAIKIDPDCYEAWNKRGCSLSYLERNEEALGSFDNALKIKSDVYEIWFNRGNYSKSAVAPMLFKQGVENGLERVSESNQVAKGHHRCNVNETADRPKMRAPTCGKSSSIRREHHGSDDPPVSVSPQ